MKGGSLLLRGLGLTKIYSSPLAPLVRLKQDLFGIAPQTCDSHVVLKDVDIEVHRGEALGIMGRNGAGKSTLLGILGNVIEPTAGMVERRGKVAVLLEIGAGFHPNFTGRENARLFCSIMGLNRAETERRMDGIQSFADIGDYFDLPLRTYSSGMHARLGFACAIHVDAELVIIDETLAVGDASFRMKCFRHIESMKERGQTFLIVSHNQNLISNFCTRAILLEGGRKMYDGSTLGAVKAYKALRLALEEEAASRMRPRIAETPTTTRSEGGNLSLEQIRFEEALTGDGERLGIFRAELATNRDIAEPVVNFGIRNGEGIAVCSYSSSLAETPLPPLSAGTRRSLTMTFLNRLTPGAYYASFRTSEMVGGEPMLQNSYLDAVRFDIVRKTPTQGIVDLDLQIELNSERVEAAQ